MMNESTGTFLDWRNPHNYIDVRIPAPVFYSGLTPLQKNVYEHYFAAEKLHSIRNWSIGKIARNLGASRRGVRKVMDELEREGFILRTYSKTSSGLDIVEVKTTIPEKLRADCERWLGRSTRFSESDEGRELSSHPQGTEFPPPRELSSHNRRVREKKREESKECNGDAVAFSETPKESSGTKEAVESSEVGEAGEKLDLDSGSLAAQRELDRRKEERARKREEKIQRKDRELRPATSLPSGEEFLHSPSERPEWKGWREKEPGKWTARDLVGFWVCRFREVKGREDPEFVSPSYHSPQCARATKLCREYVRQHLDGSNHRFRDAVEKILEKADGERIPCSLFYFMTPSNPMTLASLDRERRNPRTPTPVEVNDAMGSDREYWERRGKEELEKRKRKAAKLGIPLDEVSLRVGEKV
jgi:hypothetical protein